MDCNKYIEMISFYIDNELSEPDRIEFENHIKECKECEKIYNETLEAVNTVRSIEKEDLPDDYKISLRRELEKERGLMKQPKRYKKWIGLGAVAAVFFILLLAPGMSNFRGGNDSSVEYSTENSADMDMAKEEFGESMENEISSDDSIGNNEYSGEEAKEEAIEEGESSLGDRKIIRNVHINIDITEFNKVLKEITNYIKSKDGYIQNSDIQTMNRGRDEYREGYINLRIPQQYLNEAIDVISGKGKVNNLSMNSDDITKAYMDTEARLKNLEVQEERLREIISKAEKIDDILNIENELRRVRTEIEQLQSTIKNWDNLVSLSTISLRMVEVDTINSEIKSVDDNILAEAKKGFIATINVMIDAVQWIFITLVTLLPALVVLGALVIVYFIWRRKKNKE